MTTEDWWSRDPVWRDKQQAVIAQADGHCCICGYECRSMHAIPFDREHPFENLVPVCGACKAKVRLYTRIPPNVSEKMRYRLLGQPHDGIDIPNPTQAPYWRPQCPIDGIFPDTPMPNTIIPPDPDWSENV